MSDLNNRTAVITGGGSGIGAAVARALADAGCQVAITGRRQEALDTVTGNYNGDVPIIARTSDVADRDTVNAFFGWATEELGHIDILVNSAGINTPVRSVAKLDPANWDQLIAVNLTGAYNCIHAVLPGMREQADGVIVNISSVAGIRAVPIGGVAYNASKFGMSALGITVAEEHRDQGIRVTNIYPGEVETPILDKRPVPVSAEHRARILQPEDCADAVMMVVRLPARANVPELVIIPTSQSYC
jgi:NADP-dependent 3-hydroxy acid dehydrogenase YdfG